MEETPISFYKKEGWSKRFSSSTVINIDWLTCSFVQVNFPIWWLSNFICYDSDSLPLCLFLTLSLYNSKGGLSCGSINNFPLLYTLFHYLAPRTIRKKNHLSWKNTFFYLQNNYLQVMPRVSNWNIMNVSIIQQNSIIEKISHTLTSLRISWMHWGLTHISTNTRL